jgi:hypothetical protein
MLWNTTDWFVNVVTVIQNNIGCISTMNLSINDQHMMNCVNAIDYNAGICT